MTATEVAEALGLSAEHVRQIESAALQKLRRHAEERGLTTRELMSMLAAPRDQKGGRP